MLRPLDVACGFCAAQPGEPCRPPVDAATGVHAQRIETAAFINGVESRTHADAGTEPSVAQFDQAALASGII